jgi:hypothetical protein
VSVDAAAMTKAIAAMKICFLYGERKGSNAAKVFNPLLALGRSVFVVIV